MEPQLKDLPIFFILGRERSGTTLLRLMLDNHSAVHIPLESPFINYLEAAFGDQKEWTEKLITRFVKALLSEPYLSMWDLDEAELLAELLRRKPNSFGEACKAVILFSSKRAGKNVHLIGDKNPQYCLNTATLRRIFPEAKFVFITRDPRDQVDSMLKVNFERKDPVALACRWSYINNAVLKQMNKAPEKFLHLKYEDLLRDPEARLIEVCAFLNIPFELGLTSTAEKAKSLVKDKRLIRDHHASLVKPVDVGMVELWRKHPASHHHHVAYYSSSVMKKLGYGPEEMSSTGVMLLSLKHLPSIVYGYLYFPFLKAFNAFPFAIRQFVFRKVIASRFQFWKEAAEKK